jgi:RNase P subunit RPR2
VLIYQPDHPDASKAGYVMEHRLVMERELGRRLLPTEIVHHRNNKKADNRPENLEVMEKRKHDKLPKPPKRTIRLTCPHCKTNLLLVTNARIANANLSISAMQ